MEELNESTEPLTEPSPPKEFIPNRFGLREIEATFDMIIQSREAIRRNQHWDGHDLEAMAMLLAMLGQMEGQYRVQLETKRAEEKEALKRAKAEIQKAGGVVNGRKE